MRSHHRVSAGVISVAGKKKRDCPRGILALQSTDPKTGVVPANYVTQRPKMVLVSSEKLAARSRRRPSAAVHKDTVQSTQNNQFEGPTPGRSRINRNCVERHSFGFAQTAAPFYSSALLSFTALSKRNNNSDGLARNLLLNKQTRGSTVRQDWRDLKVCGAKRRPSLRLSSASAADV